MSRPHSFFSFPHPANEVSSRLIAAGVVILAGLAVGLSQPWLAVALAVGYLGRVAAGPRLSLLGQLVNRVVMPAFGNPRRPVAGPPKRFAQAIGLVFTASAATLWLGFGLEGAAYGVLGALIGAAFLEAAFAFCLGCKVFGLLMQAGAIPASVCEECENWESRARRAAPGREDDPGAEGRLLRPSSSAAGRA